MIRSERPRAQVLSCTTLTPSVEPKIIALVPMRHESERVPGKNYRPFAGRPLYHHVIRSLMASGSINGILIDTDSELIRDDASRHFPSVQLVSRPLELRGGDVPMNEVLLHDITVVEADYYLQTHSTNPLLRPETIATATNAFLTSREVHDSLFSVTALQTRLWSADGDPLNHDADVLVRTQDLPRVYEENSCIYLFTREGLQRRRNRIGERPLMFEIDRREAWDIDEELDFEVAEFLFHRLERR